MLSIAFLSLLIQEEVYSNAKVLQQVINSFQSIYLIHSDSFYVTIWVPKIQLILMRLLDLVTISNFV
jgi:hypothetical protein